MTTSILRRTTLTTLRISHRPPPLPSLLLTPTSHLQQRTLTSSSRLSATSEVAKNPGSQDFDDLRKNAQEEAKGVAGAVVGAISGGGVEQTTQHVGGLQSDLASVKSLAENVPQDALKWGAIGSLPYLGMAFGTVHLSRQASDAVAAQESTGLDAGTALHLLENVQHLQMTYGAVMLSFVGAVHWGLEFAKYGGSQGTPRFAAGVAPAIIGWGSLLLGPQAALITQWSAFFGSWLVDQKATTWGWAPKWYSTYRFWLTTIAGGSILLTLGGESYFGPDTDAMRRRAQLDLAKSNAPTPPTGNSVELGEMRAEKSDEAFVKFSNVKEEQEQRKKDEEKKEKEKEENLEKDAEEALLPTKEEREKMVKRAQSQSGKN